MKHTCLLFTLLAFGFAVLAFFNYHGNVNDNSVLALISICTTLIVGINVVDAIRVNEIEKKINELNNITSSLEISDKQVKVGVYVAWGLAFLNWLPYTAFNHLQKGLIIALQIEDPHKVDLCLKCMEEVPDIIKRMKKKKQEIDDKGFEKISKSVIEEISSHSFYKPFQKRIEDVYNKLFKIIEEKKTNV